MTELGGLVWLVAALVALGAASTLAACCLRIRSPVEFAVAVYVLGWGWLVGATFLLSPAALVSRVGLTSAIAIGLAAAAVAWRAAGRPSPPDYGDAISRGFRALRTPALLILASAVGAGVAYTLALAFLVPANDGDALAYHLSRAFFWKQEHQLGYIANAVDLRLNVNPPNAEIGQLATVVFSASDRYVALPQLAASGALCLCVVGLARRIGLGVDESLFAGLAFATLSAVAVGASSALNDLVVASFLAAAVLFALRPGRASLVVAAVALGLGLGTKFTAVLALPTIALVLAFARPPHRWLALAFTGIVGVGLGSAWYVVNLVETGDLDGGLGGEADQRAEPSVPAIATTAMRLTLDVVDMSGAPRPYSAVFALAAAVLVVLSLWRARRAPREAAGMFAAACLTAAVVLAPELVDFGRDQITRAWAFLGRPETPTFEFGWGLNVEADPTLSWFGPLGALLLSLGTAYLVISWLRGQVSTRSLGLVLAPWALLLTLAVTVVWDPFRGRFLVVAIALAAATWGVFLRSTIASSIIVAVGTTSLALALINYVGKPAGLGEIWARSETPVLPLHSVWAASRADTQTRLRPETGEESVFEFLENTVPADARVAVAARENDFLSPYFGPRVSRHVTLLTPRSPSVPPAVDWLVLAPSTRAGRCTEAWRRELTLEVGWRIERRIGPDACLR